MQIYHEKQQTYLIFYLILFIEIPVMLLIIGWGLERREYGPSIFIAIILGAMIFVLANFFHMHIRVFSDRLWVNFGLFGKTVKFSGIQEVAIEPYEFKKYLGWGIRYSIRDKSQGWVTRSGRGILIKTKNHKLFLSTENPERLAELIQSGMARSK